MIGERIRELRKKYEMTQTELAKKLGVSSSTVGMYEQNRREPGGELVLRIAQIFGVTADYLLSGEPEKEAPPGELSEIMDDFSRRLLRQKGLMFNGRPLSDEDVSKIIDAMKIGAEIAMREK